MITTPTRSLWYALSLAASAAGRVYCSKSDPTAAPATDAGREPEPIVTVEAW